MKKKLTKMIGIRMTEEMYEKLEEEADRMRLRVADLGRWAIAQLLGQDLRRDPGRELWQTWYDWWNGNPYYLHARMGDLCFFCGNPQGQGHDHCVYVSVCELLEVEPK